MIYKNNEGYADPTAGAALNGAELKIRKTEYNPEVTNLVTVLKQIVDLAGYEIAGRITLKNKSNGKEYH